MKEILSGLYNNIYNKVLNFFNPDAQESTKDEAKNRLKLVLMHDRAGLSEKILVRLRGELIDVISKYMEINHDELDLKLESAGDSVALMLGIQVIRAKTDEEIEAALQAEQDERQNIENLLEEALEKLAQYESEEREAENAENIEDTEQGKAEEEASTEPEIQAQPDEQQEPPRPDSEEEVQAEPQIEESESLRDSDSKKRTKKKPRMKEESPQSENNA